MGRPMATTVSCLRSAITGLRTRQNGIGLIATLGGEPMNSVPVYANINRSLLGENRSPEAFAGAVQTPLVTTDSSYLSARHSMTSLLAKLPGTF